MQFCRKIKKCNAFLQLQMALMHFCRNKMLNAASSWQAPQNRCIIHGSHDHVITEYSPSRRKIMSLRKHYNKANQNHFERFTYTAKL